MSYSDTKMEEAQAAAGRVRDARARRRLDPRCSKPDGECAQLECLRGYHVLERDARGPTAVGVRSMDKLWIWRRVQMDGARDWLFELEGIQASLPNL